MLYFVELLLSLIGPAAYLPADDFVTLHGKVVDMNSRLPINAEVDIFYNSDFIKDYSGSTRYGEFTTPLRNFGWYIISTSAPGYLVGIDTLWVTNGDRTVIVKNIPMAPIEVGLTVRLNNIYFDSDKASLLEESFMELDNMVKFFKRNPGVDFEVAGYADSDGPEDYNLMLSQERARTVVGYLVSHGVSRSGLVAHAYGETRFLDTSGTRSGKAKNRRVEVTVLNIGLGGLLK